MANIVCETDSFLQIRIKIVLLSDAPAHLGDLERVSQPVVVISAFSGADHLALARHAAEVRAVDQLVAVFLEGVPPVAIGATGFAAGVEGAVV